MLLDGIVQTLRFLATAVFHGGASTILLYVGSLIQTSGISDSQPLLHSGHQSWTIPQYRAHGRATLDGLSKPFIIGEIGLVVPRYNKFLPPVKNIPVKRGNLEFGELDTAVLRRRC